MLQQSICRASYCLRGSLLSICFSPLFTLYIIFYTQAHAGSLVATLPGDFSVGNTGAAQYSIPIEIPEGTAGVQPQLSINYNISD
tara:strand:+ start:259 stop:513 length:255 start_codon:yes stop_codon:yes gene_type:complete